MKQIILNYLSVTRVHGNDAESFLQAQLTADLTKLSSGEACISAFCRPNGNVLAVLLVVKHSDGYGLIASAELMDDLVNELSRFVLRADVHFQKMRDHSVMGCMTADENLPKSCVPVRSSPLHYCISDTDKGGSEPEEVEHWRWQELYSGLTWLNRETSDSFIPQMLGLDTLDGVSFRKGCYPGQEVIARVRYLGKLKRRPVVVATSQPLQLRSGEELNVFRDDGEDSSAVVVDSVTGSQGTLVFLVARMPEGSKAQAIGIDDQRIELSASVQT